MEKFKFSGHASSWPDWFNTLAEKGKARINIDVKQVCDNDDDWREYRTYIAFLWTPGKIIVAYEGDTIVNRGAYCELEQRQMAVKRLAKAHSKSKKKERKNSVDELLIRFGRK